MRPPVFLSRRPDEPPDRDLAVWYRSLIAAVGASAMRVGEWHLLDAEVWPDNQTGRNLIAWSWSGPGGAGRHLVVVNLSGAPAQGMVQMVWPDLKGRTWKLVDLLEGTTFEREGGALAESGLYVALEPWRHHVLAMNPA